MFFQPPEIEAKNSNNTNKSASALKSARRKRRKRAEKLNNKKQILKKEKQRFANTMSSWAENFTMAATWQLKHQVAHWKSKAKALEYENNILRSMLRQYYVKGKAPQSVDCAQEPMSTSARSESETEQDATDGAEVEEDEESQEEVREQEGEDIQISEEFIDFLKSNAEFRKMRIERERLRQLEKEMPTRLLEKCPDAPTDKKFEYEKLYGVRWQRIAALEMSIQSQFISDCDKDKPIMWPTIPFRL